MSPSMRPGVRGHTVPNLVRQRRRLIRIIKRNQILIRAQGAVIGSLKGQERMRLFGETPTPEQMLLESVKEMKRECELIQGELAERDEDLALAQERVKELTMDLAQLSGRLTRPPR